MKILAKLVALIFVIFPLISSGRENPSVANSASPMRCELFFSSGCFAVSLNDVVTMEIVADFVLYDIKFSAGGTALIYVGFNPSSVEDQGKQYESCEWISKFSECKIRTLSDGRVEFLARQNRRSQFIHVVITKDFSKAKEFIRTIRPCKLEKNTLKCGA